MTVHDLNQDQLEELRGNFFVQLQEQNVLGDITTPEEIPMSNVMVHYADTYFVNDDFFCSDEEIQTEFPNGFASWQETHYEIVAMLTLAYERENPIITEFNEKYGTGGLYDIAESWAFKFEEQTKDRFWYGEFFEEIEEFFNEQLNNLL